MPRPDIALAEPDPNETPIDEYERSRAENARAAWLRLCRLSACSLAVHIYPFLLVCIWIAALNGLKNFPYSGPYLRSESFLKVLVWAVPITVCGALLPYAVLATLAAASCLRHWNVLRGWQRAIGLLPWTIAVAESSLILISFVL